MCVGTGDPGYKWGTAGAYGINWDKLYGRPRPGTTKIGGKIVDEAGARDIMEHQKRIWGSLAGLTASPLAIPGMIQINERSRADLRIPWLPTIGGPATQPPTQPPDTTLPPIGTPDPWPKLDPIKPIPDPRQPPPDGHPIAR
jgi:hypothetical protein